MTFETIRTRYAYSTCERVDEWFGKVGPYDILSVTCFDYLDDDDIKSFAKELYFIIIRRFNNGYKLRIRIRRGVMDKEFDNKLIDSLNNFLKNDYAVEKRHYDIKFV